MERKPSLAKRSVTALHVGVDAEDLLDDDETGFGGSDGLGYVGAELEVVGGGEGDFFSHDSRY